MPDEQEVWVVVDGFGNVQVALSYSEACKLVDSAGPDEWIELPTVDGGVQGKIRSRASGVSGIMVR